jgi:hypothetical protein
MDDVVARALHAARQHFDEGGFLDSIRGMFSGPDYQSTGEVASPTNWGNPDSAADFFRADKARMAAERAPDVVAPLPPRRPVAEAEPRPQIAAAPPAPAPSPALPSIGPYDFGQAVTEHQIGKDKFTHLAELPGFGQSLDEKTKMPRADMRPEVGSSWINDYQLPAVALARQVMAPQEVIPSFDQALANVENFQNAGVFSGNEYDRAGEILQAHNRARDAGIPVEEALRLNRAAGPMMINQGMPGSRTAAQPLAYSPTSAPAPASAAIDAATGKLTNRVDPNSDVERATNVWNRMLRQESGGRQFDRDGRTITSPAGALGISQVMPSTGPEAAQLAGLPWSLERLRTDPEYNHALGRAYYDAQLARFGDPILAAAAYNGGPGRVAGALRQAQATGRPWTDFLRPETQNYVRVVGRAEGGLVDDALHVVREHHADGEAVGPTMQQRLRATIASIDPEGSRDQPVMDPEKMGEAWNRARQNYQNFPVQEGEAVVRPLELGARDVIGGAIAGGAREPGAQFRRGLADMLVGSTGLPNSGTLGVGVADLPMVTGIPLTLADMARDVGQGDYASTAMGAALPAAFYARGPLGAAGRRAVEIAREYAKPAAATAAGITANVVTPEDAEAAKLPKLPGTFKHPLSGTKLVTPIEEMRPVFSAPTEAITPRKPMNWAATEGGVYMPATWDRSRGDRAILEEINGQKLTNPQRMEGGPLYMNWGDVQPEKQVAASGQSIVDRMIETSAEAKKLAGDKDVYLANVLMGLEGADFSHMVANPLVDLARQRGFSKSEAALVDDAIRKSIIQNLPSKAPMDKKVAYASAWPGIMHPDLDQLMWKMGGGYRSAIAKAMDTAAMKTLGVPDVASIRHAATQPELLNSPNLSTGFSVAKVDPGAPSVSSGHTTYPVGMKGLGYEGGSQVDIPFNLFWRDFMKTRPPGESMAHTQRAFTMQMPVQKADPQWVDTISNFERNALRGAIPLE